MASASEHLALGHTHRRSGNLSAALEEYERALKLAPDSAEAMSLCGLANLHLGKQDLAGPLLQAAVDMQPANVGFMLNLVSYLERAGRIDDALGLLRRAKDLNPDFFLPFARLAGLLETQGAWEEAHENYLQASLRSSMNYDYLIPAIRCALLAKKFVDAEQLLQRASAQYMFTREVLNLYADLFHETERWRSLLGASLRWTESHPEDSRAWFLLSRAQFETGNFDHSLRAFDRYKPDTQDWTASDFSLCATTAMQAGKLDRAAMALSDVSVKLQDHEKGFATLRAQILMYFGHFDEAQDICNRQLDTSPGDASAFRILGLIDPGAIAPAHVSTIESQLADGHISKIELPTCHYALGHYFDAQKEFGRAFFHYSQANLEASRQAASDEFRYDQKLREATVQRVVQAFSSAEARRQLSVRQPKLARTPLFIVGMPRSGTTFLETTLSEHPNVAGLGEREHIPSLLNEFLLSPQLFQRQQLIEKGRETYFSTLDLDQNKTIVIDKNPFNFDTVGLIKVLFPQSVIVHIYRDPIDTCWSIFKNEFIRSVTFTSRMEDIVHYFRQYQRVMTMWDSVFPGEVIHLDYDEFVKAPDAWASRIWSRCGLAPAGETERAKTKETRPILTLSAVQVRKSDGPVAGKASDYLGYFPKDVQDLLGGLTKFQSR